MTIFGSKVGAWPREEQQTRGFKELEDHGQKYATCAGNAWKYAAVMFALLSFKKMTEQ